MNSNKNKLNSKKKLTFFTIHLKKAAFFYYSFNGHGFTLLSVIILKLIHS